MPSDLAGMIERIHPDDREAFRQETDRVITTETPFHLKYQMRRKDGSYITIEDQGCFFRDSAGNLVRMVGFLVDITERKRAEEERQQLQRQLFQAQKLESVGTPWPAASPTISITFSPRSWGLPSWSRTRCRTARERGATWRRCSRPAGAPKGWYSSS